MAYGAGIGSKRLARLRRAGLRGNKLLALGAANFDDERGMRRNPDLCGSETVG